MHFCMSTGRIPEDREILNRRGEVRRGGEAGEMLPTKGSLGVKSRQMFGCIKSLILFSVKRIKHF